MYPFGSGMPQPNSNSPYHNNHNNPNPGAPVGVPFGAGWIAPTQHATNSPHHMQHQNSLHYQPLPTQHQTPYPTSNNPTQHQPAPYPPISSAHNTPYPGSSYPHNPQHAQAPYPSASGTPTHGTSGSVGFHATYPSHSPHYTPPATHPSYAPTHGYTPVPTSSGYESPAGNMAHCFQELAHLQGNVLHHHQPFARREGTPTVFPAQNFDPVKDAHDLRKAMKGFGTDEDALINIICRRSNEQRQEIQRQYKTHFGKDLIEDIKSETSGNFEKLLVGLLRPIVDFYCAEMNDAMAGIGTDEDVLIEILCTLSNVEIHTIKNQYLRLYGAHLESELKSETSGNFKRLLVSLCTAARDESGQIDPVAAQADARELLKAGELRVGTDESMFNMILCQRNYQQLRLIFQEYEKMTGHTLEKAIRKEFSGDIMEGLVAIYKCVTHKTEYFAARLHKSMAGIGTNDKQLIRVVITRSEIDLADIKAQFERMYGKSLKSWIKGDTSGHYKHALYALVGEQRSS
ncbi:annexin B11 isoform X1 [Ceratitis capitata]|uniref:annexin B11 isoform X1 n=1 Tax=Ceratitis capitata TaxID=7213 RepID=UPI00032A3374|nr:annexin B11 isoform X1 [Ceratitis capitata]XP_012154896.1 annexin B11 isoform X1 [Ceratitis capitata]XP_020712815.1 annexin B11 isoform X1 [Ceratitis capitata]XP_020712816.1 annexin B11 isoform X1 [Ceratitis capitata]